MSICMTCKLPLGLHTGNICPIGRPLNSVIEKHIIVCDKCKQPWKDHVFGGEYIICPAKLCDNCKKYFVGEKCTCNKTEIMRIVTKHFDNLFKNLALFPEFKKDFNRCAIHDKLNEKINQFLGGIKVEYEKADLEKDILNWVENGGDSLKSLLETLKTHKHGTHGTNYLIQVIQRRINAS